MSRGSTSPASSRRSSSRRCRSSRRRSCSRSTTSSCTRRWPTRPCATRSPACGTGATSTCRWPGCSPRGRASTRAAAPGRGDHLRPRPLRTVQQAPRPSDRRRGPARLRLDPDPAPPLQRPGRPLRGRGVPRRPRRGQPGGGTAGRRGDPARARGRRDPGLERRGRSTRRSRPAAPRSARTWPRSRPCSRSPTWASRWPSAAAATRSSPPDDRPARDPGPVGFRAMPLVATTALTKHYPGGVTALDALTSRSSPGSSASSAPTAPARARCCGSSSACCRRPPGAPPSSVYDVRDATGTTLRRFVGYMPESDCLPPDIDRDRPRRPDGAGCRACRPRPPASAPPRCSATSGCTRSATGRSAGTRPA